MRFVVRALLPILSLTLSCVSPKTPKDDDTIFVEITASDAADSFNPSDEHLYELSECVPNVIRGKKSAARARIHFTLRRRDLTGDDCRLEVVNPALVVREDVSWPSSRPGVLFATHEKFAIEELKTGRATAAVVLTPTLVVASESDDLHAFSIPVTLPDHWDDEQKNKLVATMQCFPKLPFPGRFVRKGEKDTITFYVLPPHPTKIACRSVAAYVDEGKPLVKDLNTSLIKTEDGKYILEEDLVLDLKE
ncbi:MAG: hypothetical protein AB7T49_16020 [Oligoflexales bacterium]